MLVVVDTNVLVSALLNPYGTPASILGLILDEKLSVCFDSRILREYEDVLMRPKFNFDRSEVAAILEFIKEFGQPTIAGAPEIKTVHHDDLPFIQVAVSAKARYLITGNLNHFPKKIDTTSVLSPKMFIDGYSGAIE
ncbi:MAG: putative toxin-antitoxin system toxin component, PIN family [Chitinivibrionales bacterium]|nr:putative toxin-antitoxin system toxin component, PIN family [Chitinivibrionales bacterium]